MKGRGYRRANDDVDKASHGGFLAYFVNHCTCALIAVVMAPEGKVNTSVDEHRFNMSTHQCGKRLVAVRTIRVGAIDVHRTVTRKYLGLWKWKCVCRGEGVRTS